MDTLGTRFKALRIYLGLKQGDIARLANLRRTNTISELERDAVVDPQDALMEKYAAAMKLPLPVLLDYLKGDIELLDAASRSTLRVGHPQSNGVADQGSRGIALTVCEWALERVSERDRAWIVAQLREKEAPASIEETRQQAG